MNITDLRFSPRAAAKGTQALIDLISKHKTFIDSRLQPAVVVNNLSPDVKTSSLRGLNFSCFEEPMDFQVKLFSWPDRGNHLIMIARGVMDIRGFEQIFREVLAATQPLRDCKVVIDLQDAACNLECGNIQAFVDEVDLDLWPLTNKIAIVSPHGLEQYDLLSLLSIGLAQRGLKVAVFYDSKPAVTWLADTL